MNSCIYRSFLTCLGTLGKSFFRQLWLDAFLRKECYCKQITTCNYCKFQEIFGTFFIPRWSIYTEITSYLVYSEIPSWRNEILPSLGEMKNVRVHINVTTKLWKNDSSLLISFIVPSCLLACPSSHINRPLQRNDEQNKLDWHFCR